MPKLKSKLKRHRKTMMRYLLMKFEERDWHGVQDAASDLRDIESELKGLKMARKRPTN